LSAARRIANAARGTAALRPAPVVLLHNVKQPAAWPDTQPISFPRRIFCARVVASCCFVSAASPLHVPALRRGSGPNPWRQLQLRPRNEGAGGAPGGVPPYFVAPVRRDLTLARRARPAQPGRPPLGAPPWRCPGPAASPAFPPEPGQGWLAGHRS
jgi:hypothetical protein